MKSALPILAIVLLLCAGAFVAPATPFIVDGGVYYDMARALADHGKLHIAENGGIESGPPLTKFLTVAHEGTVYPQYPSGYAFIAAPFYKLLGVNGLMLMNALGFGISIWLTFAIAKRFYDRQVGQWSAVIFATASFAPTYAFGIWPHMVSLACWLGAIFCIVVAQDQGEGRKPAMLYILAGLLVGAGLNVRVDVVLAALVIFFWLRLFAKPSDRIAPVFLVLGLTPGLVFSAWLNSIKFGALTPFSYGPTGGADSIDRYLPVLALAAIAVVLTWLVDVSKFPDRAVKFIRRYWSPGAIAAALFIIAITPLRELAWRTITGLYVLVFNLQAHDAYYQAGVERNEFGQLLFWGYPKKAFIQSLPWAPLIILPLFSFLRGKHVRAVSLCLLAIAAPIAFYALSHWHGGGSYSMRYFLPAVPFLAILSAWGLRSLTTKAGPNRQTILIALVAAAALYLGLQEVGQSTERFLAPAALYPQWLIAAAVAVAVCFTLTRPYGEKPRRIASGIALFALAYGVAINLYEEIGHERTRAEQMALAEDISAPVKTDALVVTGTPLSFIPAERNGAFVMAVDEKNFEKAATAARAFLDNGRCVYIHNTYALNLIENELDFPIRRTPLWAVSRRFENDPRLAFFLPDGAESRCWPE
ncbi:glycosyltransferase family 39 protein [Hyphococcus flavus]|uniref:Glycosyltransferase family 39 protein n=1 Tax=Hyphococcus flavus TaxID=1866326 RepID=A0AAE9ZHU0_9PROT|nr:glycosyltransferase family 39 protein [Hyphococcus flavus]WDI33122.1 glycosyltransferase family 39 protein [Hyphococcus flavus]